MNIRYAGFLFLGFIVGCQSESRDELDASLNAQQDSAINDGSTSNCDGSACQSSYADGGVARMCDEDACAAFCISKGVAYSTCNGTQCLCADSATTCSPGAFVSCYSGPLSTASISPCKSGTATCGVTTAYPKAKWSACIDEHLPSSEICNDVDDDCDGHIDNKPGFCHGIHQDCGIDSDCKAGLVCVSYASGFKTCDDACTQSCPAGFRCVRPQNSDAGYCYYEPQTTCWSHAWWSEAINGQTANAGSCMNCNGKPELAEGSSCTASNAGADLSLRCEPISGAEVRRDAVGLAYRLDFMAVDFPLQNPFEMERCLVAWGIHKATEIDARHKTATLKLVGAAGNTSPLQMQGFTTRLPAIALPHFLIEKPPLPKVFLPTSREERAARIIWDEPSVTGNFRNTHLPLPDRQCSKCETYGNLVDYMYPGDATGARVYCQGLGRDPADSQFVIPIHLPYYDSSLGTDIVILTEIICELSSGAMDRSVSVWPIADH